MQWMVPINSLDVRQREVLDAIVDEPALGHWVSGYAGTGKTIVITHVLERLALKRRTASICFVTYTHALKDLVASGLNQQVASRIAIRTADTIKNESDTYDFIVVDEIQDIKLQTIERVRARAHHLIVAGDSDQSIYRHGLPPARLLAALGNPVIHELREIHRLTRPVFELAKAVNPGAKVTRGTKIAEGREKPRLVVARSRSDEYAEVYAESVRLAEPELPCAILFPTHDMIHEFASVICAQKGWSSPPRREQRGPIVSYEAFNRHFSSGRRAPLQFLGSNNGSLPESDRRKIVYLMTYHSAKGLDFSTVFVPGLTDDLNIVGLPEAEGSGWVEAQERRLLFVAFTRTRDLLFVSCHGDKHRRLEELSDSLFE